MAADDAAVVVTLRANLKDYEAALKSAVRSTERAAAAAEKAVSNVGRGAGASNVVAVNFQKGAKEIANDARMLQFQLNDIFSGIASGQGIRAVQQQLGQIAQQMSGGGLVQGARTMGAALVGMINPINLAVVAFGLLASVTASYFENSEDDAKEFEKTLKSNLDIINRLREARGQPSVSRGKDPLDQLIAERDAIKAQAEATKLVKEQVDAVQSALLGIPLDTFEGQTYTVQQLDSALTQLQRGIAQGNPDFLAFVQTLSEIKGIQNLPDDIKELVTQVTELALKGAQAARDLKDLQASFGETARSLKVLDDAFAGSFGQTILSAIEAVIQKMGGLNEALYKIKSTLGGFGDFLTKTWEEVGASIKSAGDLIRKEEGFRPKAYWDTNAFRVGFGSDTYVDAMGKVQKVTKDTVVTLDQANTDLSRRIVEFQQTIVSQVGPDFWRSLSEQQQAALTSIAYNYGRLPPSIVAAIKKGDQGQVAAAIAGLSANPERRRREAELFAGGAASSEPLKKVETAQDAVKSLADWNVETERRIQLEKQVAEINAQVWQSEAQRAAQIEALRTAEEKLAELRKAGVTVTAEQEQQIRSLAQAQADVTLKSKEAAERQQQFNENQKRNAAALQEMNQQMAGIIGGGLSSFVQDLMNGEKAGDAFANMLRRMAAQMADMVIQMLIIKPLMNSLFGGLGGDVGFPLAPGGLFHGGGVVGRTRVPTRMVDPRIWKNAPRFATGGVVGLRPGEVPIIAHRGETIIPRGASAAPTNVTNNVGDIQVTTPGYVTATTDDGKQLGKMINQAVEVILVQQSRPGGILRKVG
jgi:GH24 family phage-related lysozyme (muramidase)